MTRLAALSKPGRPGDTNHWINFRHGAFPVAPLERTRKDATDRVALSERGRVTNLRSFRPIIGLFLAALTLTACKRETVSEVVQPRPVRTVIATAGNAGETVTLKSEWPKDLRVALKYLRQYAAGF